MSSLPPADMINRPSGESARDAIISSWEDICSMQVPLLYHCLTRFTQAKGEPWAKTYNSGYSLVVTHLTTNPPVRCLNRAERTGSLVFNVLWSYVEGKCKSIKYIVTKYMCFLDVGSVLGPVGVEGTELC